METASHGADVMRAATFWILIAGMLLLPLAPFALPGLTNASGIAAPPPEVAAAVENTVASGFSPGDHWAYEVTFQSGRTRDIAIVVHEARADGYRLGSNVSNGFFGLPFKGNLSRDLNPEIAGETWPMFRFPLSDGMRWSYTMLGYEAETLARAAIVDAPGLGEHAGFRLEASSYGQVFARYEYSPLVGWLTSIELIEPTTRATLLAAKLLHHGADYGRGYFVEEHVERVRITYPDDPLGFVTVQVPDGIAQVRVSLVARASGGVIDASLVDEHGRAIVQATTLGTGVAADSATFRTGAATWTLRHGGAAIGAVVLEVTGLVAYDPSAAARSAQSTLPDLPQTGHVTSTGWPVAV